MESQNETEWLSLSDKFLSLLAVSSLEEVIARAESEGLVGDMSTASGCAGHKLNV